MLLTIITLALPLVIAAPAPSDPKPLTIRGASTPGQQGLYKRADGSFSLAYFEMERDRIMGKYTPVGETVARVAQAIEYSLASATGLEERAVANEPLTDQLDQGQDVTYYSTSIKIGTPAQSLSAIFDTGSSDLWVPSTGNNCQQETFKTAASSTYKGSTKPFIIQYGSGDVNGTIAIDKVSIAGLTVNQQTFGAVTQCSSQFVGQPSGGILGLAFSSIANTRAPTFVENLISQGSLTKKVFGLYLGRGSATGSECTFGGVDSSHYTGSFQYTPVTSKTYWQVKANSPIVNGATVGSSYAAAIDSGTTLIYVPTAIAKAIYAAIPGAKYDTADSQQGGADFYSYPCSSSPAVSLTFAGTSGSFSINPKDFNLGTAYGSRTQCVGTIIGMDFQDAAGDNLAIVGDSFLKSWYSAYSYDQANGSPAVGFAKAA